MFEVYRVRKTRDRRHRHFAAKREGCCPQRVAVKGAAKIPLCWLAKPYGKAGNGEAAASYRTTRRPPSADILEVFVLEGWRRLHRLSAFPEVVRSARRGMEHGLLVCCEFWFASCIRRETTHQSMDVAQDPQIAHLVASKRQHRRTVPPR